MKSVTNKYKNEIKQYGRRIDTIITYTDDAGEEHLLDSDVLFSITPAVNSNILKSAMKGLNFESSVKVHKNTIVNVKFGVQVNLGLTVAEVNAMKVSRLNSTPVNLLSTLKGFEYINLGNYIVSEEPKYNADTFSYTHVCYDKMLYSMQDYKKLDITYPITIRDYINKICEYLGLIFKNVNDTFANYDKQIKLDLYDGYDYTFRDILDELAQATASTICINENTDELEIRYLNDTQDTIDEDYLKDVNVGFKEKYGPINSIVLSRAAESDNVFLQDKQSVRNNGLCELKIIDNQIMNDNDRSDFLPDILEKLDGLSYYINDFSSPGITWYELCDMYNVKIGENLYSCVLFNDEIKITQGLEEDIYTEMPETSETDYSKADKTDRKINKTYIMVDKQNQKIEALISQQTEMGEKLTQHEQTIDSITDTVSSVETKIETVESKTIYSVDVMYALSDSSTQIPTTGWSTTAPAWENGKYMWQKTVTTYGGGSTEETSATCITGAKGENGQDGQDGSKGDTGIGVKEIVEEYYLSTSNTSQTGGSWKTTQDTWTKGKYIWTRNKITWTDDTITYTTPVLATGLNNANSMANNANTTADTANATANEAKNTADNAITQVQTTTEKLAEVEQTVDGITQTVSSVETKIETVEGKAEQAQSSADTANKNAQAAQQTADNINNNLTTNYYTKTETNSQIQQTADSITSTVTKNISTAKQEAIDSANASIDEKLLGYATTTEMNSSIEQKADEINARINKIQDITNIISGTKSITLKNCVPGSLLELHIYGNNQVFKNLYPADNLYPSNNLYTQGDSRIVVIGFNEESKESTYTDTYELGVTDVLRQNGTTKDEYVLKDSKAQVIRRINKDGTVKTTEEIEDLGEYYIELKEVENIIQIKNYSAEMEAKYAIKNDYTDIYATKIEMNSSIKQTAEEINLEVSKKVGENEVISKINQSAEAVGINANKIELSANDVLNLLAGNTINLSSKNIKISSNKFKVDEDGNITCSNGVFLGGNIQLIRNRGMDYFQFYDTENKDNQYRLYLDSRTLGINSGDYNITMAVPPVAVGFVSIALEGNGSRTEIRNTGIKTPTLTQTSLAEEKKNFEKMSDNALNIIKSIDIYKYNLKNEKETDKKHIGFVIGDDYNYSKEVTSIDNTGVDNYSFTSLCCKAIQEQQKQIEQLTNELKELKEEK